MSKLLIPIIALFWISTAYAQVDVGSLPKDIKLKVLGIQAACRDIDPDSVSKYQQSGVSQIDLDGDGGNDFILQTEFTCNSAMKGANCSTGGCDLIVYKEIKPFSYKVVYDMTVSSSWLIVDYAGTIPKFQALGVSISPKFDECRERKQCELLLFWSKGKWVSLNILDIKRNLTK